MDTASVFYVNEAFYNWLSIVKSKIEDLIECQAEKEKLNNITRVIWNDKPLRVTSFPVHFSFK